MLINWCFSDGRRHKKKNGQNRQNYPKIQNQETTT